MKSKKLIEKQKKKKNSTDLVKTINFAKKNKKWLKVAEVLSSPRRRRINLNIKEINEKSKEGENVVIPGKILSQGEMNKKMKIVALNFSKKAEEKLKKGGCEVITILEEIKKNPEMNGLKILK
jgi:large subunit ribosomal protein L18e